MLIMKRKEEQDVSYNAADLETNKLFLQHNVEVTSDFCRIKFYSRWNHVLMISNTFCFHIIEWLL